MVAYNTGKALKDGTKKFYKESGLKKTWTNKELDLASKYLYSFGNIGAHSVKKAYGLYKEKSGGSIAAKLLPSDFVRGIDKVGGTKITPDS